MTATDPDHRSGGARRWLNLRNLDLTQRFLIISLLVIAAATLLLGSGVSYYVRSSIAEGIAGTAAASIDSLVANSLNGMFAGEVLTDPDRERLDTLFEIGSDAEATRLIQIQLFSLDDRLIYQASGAIAEQPTPQQLLEARDGHVSSAIVELPLDPTGPFGAHTISLLRIYTPLHRPGNGDVFAIAGLYYSAKSLIDIQSRAQIGVWTVVLGTGIAVVVALYAFVASANRTITRQAARLESNLAESRQMSEEILGLHQTSEQLRIDAIEANEQLLARVGSDIHDGPLQLLTLVVLQLSRAGKAAEALAPMAKLAAEAIAELRNISAGLVLPELAGLNLEETVTLAVRHYEAATGTRVALHLEGLDRLASSDAQVCIYRVVQESLSNAFRHSGGLEQTVAAVGASDGTVDLEIANARRGPSLSEDGPMRPKLGLRGMRLRVEAVGGGLTVAMSEERVVVRAVIPGKPAPRS